MCEDQDATPRTTDELLDPCAQPWCCLTCSARFRFGQMRTGAINDEHPYGVRCPQCGSGNMHPADGEVVALDAYHGEIGTVQ